MTKRRTHGSDDGFPYSENDPMDLDGAFVPTRGSQSVDYDVDDDPVGLTQAFGAISVRDDDAGEWDDNDKWKGFDWDAAPVGEADLQEGQLADDVPPSGSGSDDSSGAADDVSGRLADAEATGPSDAGAAEATAPAGAQAAASGGRGRHAAPEPEVSARMRRSRRTRRILIVLLVLLVAVIAALGYFMYRTFIESQQQAAQQAQEQVAAPRDEIDGTQADDAAEAAARLTDVPDIAAILGLSQDDAIAALGRGAMVTPPNREVNEEGNPIKTSVTVSLTEEPSDPKTRSTPTVYLGLGEDGTVLQAGYSASAAALGFGSLSFSDAIGNEHVVEKTLRKLGVNVAEGSAVLPADKSEYSTYASDGTTVVMERCSFEGDVDVNGTPCVWSSVLSYDYTTQVLTGNLSDTVRVIYAYVTVKS